MIQVKNGSILQFSNEYNKNWEKVCLGLLYYKLNKKYRPSLLTNCSTVLVRKVCRDPSKENDIELITVLFAVNYTVVYSYYFSCIYNLIMNKRTIDDL